MATNITASDLLSQLVATHNKDEDTHLHELLYKHDELW